MAPKKKSLTSKLNEAAGNIQSPTEISPKIDNPSLMSLDKIKDRDSDTRELNQKHAEALALSISAIGLIEPLVVDRDGVLLAGGHRKSAIALLQDNDPDTYKGLFSDGIPVRVMEFSALAEPDQALAVEIAENGSAFL